MREWFASGVPGLETREEDVLRAAEWRGKVIFDSRGSDRHLYPPRAGDVSDRRKWPGWPLPNVWLGVSVEDVKRKDRIDILRIIPAAVRFLSIEPLIEVLGRLDLNGIHWVIVGGESGHGARPMQIEWARSLVDQCKSAEVPVFVKQLGSHPLETECTNTASDVRRQVVGLKLIDRKGGEPSEWPADLRVREFPEPSQ
jgi:hypothetical protein